MSRKVADPDDAAVPLYSLPVHQRNSGERNSHDAGPRIMKLRIPQREVIVLASVGIDQNSSARKSSNSEILERNDVNSVQSFAKK